MRVDKILLKAAVTIILKELDLENNINIVGILEPDL